MLALTQSCASTAVVDLGPRALQLLRLANSLVTPSRDISEFRIDGAGSLGISGSRFWSSEKKTEQNWSFIIS